MSTTLTNGLKLPDKGSVDWYADMQGNYAILDGAVGTIAEHTSALAGKAPLVHTHSKTDITDFPAYGTTAGTICEGNDARLSDARTPVAHTHLTSDVTDLLNSTHTWIANQYLKNTAITNYKANPSADTYIGWTFRSNENKYWGGITHNYFTTGVSEVQISMSNWKTSGSQGYWHLDFGATKDFSNVYFRPSSNNIVDLGSSSNQWNNLYAKNYYYNGVAWGLDKQNEWTNFQRMTNNPAVWYLRNNTVTLGSAPSSNRYIGMFFEDVNGADLGYASFQANMNSYNSIMFGLRNSDGTNTYTGALRYRASTTGAYCFFPETSECDLGTSTNKWKTLNGINPGALSLPKGYTEEGADKDYIDIASVIQTLDGTLYNYTMPDNGWISVRADQANQLHVTLDNWKFGQSFYSGTAATLIVSVPFRKGDIVSIKVRAIVLEYARFYPMQGNV